MSALTINHNIPALSAHRNLAAVDRDLTRTQQHLSSGLRITRAGEGPASLVISEQMRAQIASITQALRNNETGVSMLQATEAALDEVNRQLVNIRQLALHAANDGINDEQVLEADQLEIDASLEAIDRLGQSTNFGGNKLLDGSRDVKGVASGRDVEFVLATERTQDSPTGGYPILIDRGATRAAVVGNEPLAQDVINQGLTLTVQEEGKLARITTQVDEDPGSVALRLQREADRYGLPVEVDLQDGGFGEQLLRIRHREYGSEPNFTVHSTLPDILSPTNRPTVVNNGVDVNGTIGGQVARGQGQLLVATEGSRAEGLEVRYQGETPVEIEDPVGYVTVEQNAPIFQIGPEAYDQVSVPLLTVATRRLGTGVENPSSFTALADIDVTSAQGATDTLGIVDQAINEVSRMRGRLGAVQKNSMESNLRALRVAHEELTNAESVIRDADVAEETANLTRDQVLFQTGLAMLSQANQNSRNVLSLLQ